MIMFQITCAIILIAIFLKYRMLALKIAGYVILSIIVGVIGIIYPLGFTVVLPVVVICIISMKPRFLQP